MAIQHRRGTYLNFNPSSLKPGEIAFVLSGDPDTNDGKAVYACFSAGDVKRMATHDEMGSYESNAQTAAEAAATAKADVVNLKEQIDTDLQSASTALQNAETIKSDVEDLKADAVSAVSDAETAATNAQDALAAVREKAEEVEAVVASNAYKSELGSGATGETGDCYIYLSEDFQEIIGENGAYYVFLQEEGEGKLYVSEKTDSFFVVQGTGSLAFSWEAKAPIT
ncbi:MAG: hypothetical protein IJI25_08635 [Eubacterium sp.]|nr:hypothetical protein [Eubacterium sp.]